MRWGKVYNLGMALCASWITLALQCNFLALNGNVKSMTVKSTNDIIHSFEMGNFTDIFVCIAVYLMMRYVAVRDDKTDKGTLLLSGVFAVAYIAANAYRAVDQISFLKADGHQIFLTLFCLFALLAFFYFALRFLWLYMETHLIEAADGGGKGKMDSHLQRNCFFFIFVGWLPWILANYPGAYCPDAQWQLMQFFGETPFTSHHPPLSSFLMGSCVMLGGLFFDHNFGGFLYLLFQTLAGAWIFSLGLSKLQKLGVPKRFLYVAVAFYAFTPFWGCFAQWFEKDLLFAESATLFLIYFACVVIKRECGKKDALILAVSGVVCALLRNNGIYAVLPSVFLLLFYLGKTARRPAAIALLSILFIYGGCTKILYPHVFGVRSGSIAEALSIPFQQTARYVKAYGPEVTVEEKQAISAVLDYPSLAEKYKPTISDPVKGSYKGDAAKLPAYFKAWMWMGLKHPGTYAAAFLNGSYGYIAPVKTNIEPSIWGNFDTKRYAFLDKIGLHRVLKPGASRILIHERTANQTLPFLRYTAMPGLYTWLLSVCALFLLKKKKYGMLLLLIPEMMTLLVCVASPLENAIRYALPIVAAAPLIILWTFAACFLRRRSAE